MCPRLSTLTGLAVHAPRPPSDPSGADCWCLHVCVCACVRVCVCVWYIRADRVRAYNASPLQLRPHGEDRARHLLHPRGVCMLPSELPSDKYIYIYIIKVDM